MLKINKLFSEPEVFDPIEFTGGINLILGETNETSEKTNGVGKSLCIEFINFCLLKKFSESRVSKIPDEAFSHSTLVCLRFSIHGVPVVSKRCIENHESPILIIDGTETEYFNIKDATNQLTNLLFGSSLNESHPSFRGMLSPLIRDERSEFKSIIKSIDTSISAPLDYTPHLYLLGINPATYREAIALQKDIDNTSKARGKLKKDVEELTGKRFKEANSDLNELTGQVDQIKAEMDALESAESYDIVKDELIELETKLENQRAKASLLSSELSKIKLFKGDNYINDSEVSELYERFKTGLGEMIKRELQEVTAFKRRIDDFQRTLIDSRKSALEQELKDLRRNIRSLDKIYKEKLSIVDQEGALKSLKTTVISYQKKLEEKSQLSAFIDKYNDFDQQIKITKQERSTKITILDSLVTDANSIKDEFEKAIIACHNYIMGNRRCSFNIEISEKKEVVKYELRIHDDGSHSNEREKVFIYDISLLLTPDVADFHPGLLVHDNIFDVDQDTLVKSLNYLAEKEEELNSRQYILTINSDKLHEEKKKQLKLDIDTFKRASFTKAKRFLGRHYQEV